MKKLIALAVVPLFILCSCTTNTGPSPVLVSKSRAKAWGPPSTQAGQVNAKRLVYTNPRNEHDKFVIESRPTLYGNPSYAPHIWKMTRVGGKYEKKTTPQNWKYAQILGQKIGWYQEFYPDEKNAASFRTAGFQLTHPDGRKGNYRIEGEGSESAFRSRLSELTWQ